MTNKIIWELDEFLTKLDNTKNDKEKNETLRQMKVVINKELKRLKNEIIGDKK